MPSILTQNYHTHLATEFKGRLAWSETLDALRANGGISSDVYSAFTAAANTVALYVFIGYPSPWPVDVDPPTPEETPQITGFDYWRNMLAAKRVAAANTCHVVPRVNWTSGTVYAQYDDTADLTGEQFYVLVLDGGTTYQVYKCLWNNNGAESTDQPTGEDTYAAADGYVWQYLYRLPTVSDPFLTAEWMPVYANTTIQSEALAAVGAFPTLVPLVIEYEGARYSSTANVTATIDGDGTGAAIANAGISVQGGTIASVYFSAGGNGYTNATINVYQSGNVALADVRAIVPPYPNHGYNPVHELQSKHMMCIVQFTGDEAGKLTVDNNFRQIGLLANPQVANGDLATDTFYKQTWDIPLANGASSYSPDDLIINTFDGSNTAPRPQGVLVDQIDSGLTIRLVNVNTRGYATPFATGDVLKVGGLYPSTVDDGTTGPELLPYSGHVLYVNQRIPVTRGTGEIQDLKIVLPFG